MLGIIDVSDPASPSLTATFDTTGSVNSVTLSADGNTAFIADWQAGLQIIDVSNPASPSLTGTYDTTGLAYDVTHSADGNTAFVLIPATAWGSLMSVTPQPPYWHLRHQRYCLWRHSLRRWQHRLRG